MLKSLLSPLAAAIALFGVGSTQSPANTGSNTPTRAAHPYKLTGNRSADPLGNYADDSATGLPSNSPGPNRPGAAGAGSSAGSSGAFR